MAGSVERDRQEGRPGRSLRLWLGIAVPLAVAVVAYVLWYISDRLVVIGSLDRPAFGWAVVIPVWLAVPVVGAFSWQPLTIRATRVAAIGVGLAITVVTSVLFWEAVAFPDCPDGPIRTADQWILPALILGLTIGGGVGLTGLIGTAILRSGRRWWSIAVTAGSGFAMIFVAILVFVGVSLGAGLGAGGPCGLPR
ncbi:MAG: hypothetical protein ACRDGQ_01690 [Candidatus Limnocylindrales bacterium]